METESLDSNSETSTTRKCFDSQNVWNSNGDCQSLSKRIIEILPQDKNKIDFITEKSKSNLGRQDIEDSFYVADVGRIFDLYNSWKAAFPNVHPYYAVKCNPDPVLMKVLASLGAGFDCASKNEIKAVLDLGVVPEKIVYSTPSKQISYIQYAATNNISITSVDSEDELIKIKNHYPSARLLIRLMASGIDGSLGGITKFGCSLENAKGLLDVAKQLGLTVSGVSFHVGVAHTNVICHDKFYATFMTVLNQSTELFHYARETGHKFTILDVGGGFDGNSNSEAEFNKIATKLSLQIEEFVKKFKNMEVIAEPGHYFACSPFTLATSVINKRKPDDGPPIYITTDGGLNSFMHKAVHPNSLYQPKLLEKQRFDDSLHKCSVWGPTCGPDKVSDDLYLPKLNTGDWLYFEDMGAYTMSLNPGFNGFSKPSIYYFIKEKDKKLIDTIFPELNI